MCDFERPDRGGIAEEALGRQILTHKGGRHGPVVAEVDLASDASAAVIDLVVVVLGVGGVADGAGADDSRRRAWIRRIRIAGVEAALLAAPVRKCSYTIDDARTRVGASHIVDESGIVLIPSNQTDGRDRRQRQVHETLQLPAGAAVLDLVEVNIVAGSELGWVRLVADDADGAGL